jgi:phospholipase A2
MKPREIFKLGFSPISRAKWTNLNVAREVRCYTWPRQGQIRSVSSGGSTTSRQFGGAIGTAAVIGSLAYLFYPSRQPVVLQLDSQHASNAWSNMPSVVSKEAGLRQLSDKAKAIKRREEELALTSHGPATDSATDEASMADDDDDDSAWGHFSKNFSTIDTSFSSIKWSKVSDSITDYIVPNWVKPLPGFLAKIQNELSMAPGSLAEEIWVEAHDYDINPEITWSASVRISDELCQEEKDFLKKRKVKTAKALAKYLDLDPRDLNPEDVPTIAMCGSGGGLRALVAGAGSALSAEEAGLFDCVTYTAGVSGSCWLLTLYHSSVGGRRFLKLIDHLKARLGTHIAFPPPALALLSSAPTNKFLLSGFIEKLKGDPKCDFGLVDIYGMLLAGRLLVPKGELGCDDRDLKLSNQRVFIDNGQHPLPIYAAVRHEIPVEEKVKEQGTTEGKVTEAAKEVARKEAWFQWFELTPYELWCEELQAGIPTWAVGRQFKNGQNILDKDGLGLPEYRIPLLMGIWGSAFCATLSDYYKEVRPVVKSLAGFGDLDNLLQERNEDLIKVHPIDPSSIPNYVVGLKDSLPSTCPDSLFRTDHIKLMDAGMSNNLPIYPLLRPGRDIDILIAFDASADIRQGNWLSVADGYARQRNVKGWPVGIGWPTASASPKENAAALEMAEAGSAQEAATKITDAREAQRQEKSDEPSSNPDESPTDLGCCTVWVGTTSERSSASEPPQSKAIDDEGDWQLMQPDAGISIIYFPLLPSSKVEGVDPDKTDYLSTWNFVYTPEDIDQVVALARANFDEGKEKTRRTVRAVYERKKKLRLQREAEARHEKWRRMVRLGIVGKTGEGDHFS